MLVCLVSVSDVSSEGKGCPVSGYIPLHPRKMDVSDGHSNLGHSNVHRTINDLALLQNFTLLFELIMG